MKDYGESRNKSNAHGIVIYGKPDIFNKQRKHRLTDRLLGGKPCANDPGIERIFPRGIRSQ